MLTDAGYACTEPDGDINLYVSKDAREQYYSSGDFWENRPQDKPFFLYYKLGDSHASVFKLTPDEAREQRSALLDDDELHDPNDAPVWPLEGYGLMECETMVANAVRARVVWKGAGDRISIDDPVRLRVVMRSAKLYSFRFIRHSDVMMS